jgi:hypothetical protein
MSFSIASAQEKNDTIVFDLQNDSTEYQLIIIDIGFESWLATQKPMNYYSDDYYKSWNLRYVREWNYLYNLGKYPDYIESYVDYRPGIEYGTELNYRLYQYFQFFEHKYKISLVKRR